MPKSIDVQHTHSTFPEEEGQCYTQNQNTDSEPLVAHFRPQAPQTVQPACLAVPEALPVADTVVFQKVVSAPQSQSPHTVEDALLLASLSTLANMLEEWLKKSDDLTREHLHAIQLNTKAIEGLVEDATERRLDISLQDDHSPHALLALPAIRARRPAVNVGLCNPLCGTRGSGSTEDIAPRC